MSSPSMEMYTPPPGSCDAHCHVFGPGNRFPYANSRKYTPEDAPKEQLSKLHQRLGLDRAVIVQASCHGSDNRAMEDALASSQGQFRGIAVIDEQYTEQDLIRLHNLGVRGIRFNFLRRLADPKPSAYYLDLAAKIRHLGWHIVVYFEAENLIDIVDLLHDLGTPLVIDHMGRPDVSLPINGEQFQRICSLLRNNSENWVKVSCIERLSKQGPPYTDVIPFAKYLIQQFPNQVLWGTDWPHPNMQPDVPDDEILVRSIPFMAPTQILQHKLLVDNPQRLYRFDLNEQI